MCRALLVSILAAIATGCGATSTAPPSSPPQQPLANTAAPMPAPAPERCARKLSWLETTMYFHYTEVANGHFGWSEMHADFHRYLGSGSNPFYGVVTASYRDRPDAVAKVETLSMQLREQDVFALLTTMRDELQRPTTQEEKDNRISMIDSSMSLHMTIEAVPQRLPDEGGASEGAI